MGMPGDVFDAQRRLSGGGPEPFFQVVSTDLLQSPLFQGIIGFNALEVIGNLCVVIGVLIADLEVAASVGVEPEFFLHPHQERRLSVPDDLEISVRSLRPAQVLQIDEQMAPHREPGDLVPEDDHGSGVIQRPDLKISFVGVHVHGNVVVKPSVVQDVPFPEFFRVPIIGAVKLVGIDIRKLSTEDAREGAF